KAVRAEFVKADLCRGECNKRTRHVVRAFKWGVGNELVPPHVLQALKAVDGLKAGRSAARESKRVEPVPDDFVDAVLPHLSKQVAAMVVLQRLTAMRSGEVTTMKTGEIETSGKVWMYRPATHKTAHHGRQRVIPLGPLAQAILRLWLRPALG